MPDAAGPRSHRPGGPHHPFIPLARRPISDILRAPSAPFPYRAHGVC